MGHRILYLNGSIDIPHDLERCRADVADTFFLFADKQPATADEQQRHDLRTIASVLTLKAFNPSLPLLVQLLRPENRAFLDAMPDWQPGRSATERGDQCICITELGSALLSLSARTPGASTLCTNLFSTHHLPKRVDEEW